MPTFLEEAKANKDADRRRAIRAWAAENDIPCPKGGRIPNHVLDAYLAACAKVYESEPSNKSRIEIYFNPETLEAWPASVPPRGRHKSNRIGTVLHYVENPAARMPNGGAKFTRRQFTIVIQGMKWVGTMKKDSNIVKLRPYSEAYPTTTLDAKLAEKNG